MSRILLEWASVYAQELEVQGEIKTELQAPVLYVIWTQPY